MAPPTSLAVLIEMVERIGACRGADTYFSVAEVADWPVDLVQALQAARLLIPASPSVGLVCPGCEQACWMPVHVVPGATATAGRAIIECDKREDIGPITVPISSLDRLKSSGQLLAEAVVSMLNMTQARPAPLDGHGWRLGTFEGAKHKSPLALSLDVEPRLAIAGHTVRLVDVLRFVKCAMALDVPALRKLVDSPTGQPDDTHESAPDRAMRYRSRMKQLKAQGVRHFRKRLAAEEGVDESRIGQILRAHPECKAPNSPFPTPNTGKARPPAKTRKK